MTGGDAILDRLRRHNPFASGVAGDPRKDRYPDVPGLGDPAFNGILSLIAQKQGSPETSLAGMVVGETGVGKTHLIARLIDAGINGEVPYHTAYLRPFIDPNGGFRYLLREIVVNLWMETEGESTSPLDRLAARMGCEAFSQLTAGISDNKYRKKSARLQRDPLSILSTQFQPAQSRKKLIAFAVNHFLDIDPDLNPGFLTAMLQYCLCPPHRPEAVQYLMGRVIDSDAVNRLGVPDRSGRSEPALEDEARETLISFDRMLARYGVPLVVFFDQLENLSTPEQIATFQRMIFFLGDTCSAMMPIAFFRGADWEHGFAGKLDDYCRSRLEANKYDLAGCSRDQAMALIRSRLDHALEGMDRPDPLYPFHPRHKAALESMLNAAEMHPRQVIIIANRLLHRILFNTEPAPKTEAEIIGSAYQARYEAVLANMDQYPPDRDRLALGLKLYLANRPPDGPYSVNRLAETSKSQKYIALTADLSLGEGQSAPAVVMVDVELHHKSVAASLRRGIDHLTARPGGRALYVRDGRCPFPGPDRWKETHNRLTALKARGGAAVCLSIEACACLYSLALLEQDLRSGDISDENGVPLEREHLDAFIGGGPDGRISPDLAVIDDGLAGGRPPEPGPGPKPSTGTEVVPEPKPSPEPSRWVEASIEVLTAAPPKMMKADLLTRKVAERVGMEIGLDRLLAILGEQKDRFKIFQAKDGLLVSLRMR